MSPPEPEADVREQELVRRTSPRSTLVDLVAIAVPPTAWFVHLNASYVLVPTSCRGGHGWFLFLVTVVALVAIVPSARRSFRARRSTDAEGLEAFLGMFGTWFVALFALAILLVGMSALVVGPCR